MINISMILSNWILAVESIALIEMDARTAKITKVDYKRKEPLPQAVHLVKCMFVDPRSAKYTSWNTAGS